MKTHHFENFSVITDAVDIKLNMSVLDDRFNRAQKKLDKAIMTSMVPFMPMDKGSFIARTKGLSDAVAGQGIVFAGAPPEGRFLYEGEVMVDEKTGSPWARKGARKETVSNYKAKTNKKINAQEKIDYFKGHNPEAQSHWLEPAVKKDGDSWVKVVANILGGD